MIIFITTLTYAGASTLRTIKADKQTKLITALKRKHTLSRKQTAVINIVSFRIFVNLTFRMLFNIHFQM